MKRIVLMAIGLSMCILAGCGNNNETGVSEVVGSSASATETSAAETSSAAVIETVFSEEEKAGAIEDLSKFEEEIGIDLNEVIIDYDIAEEDRDYTSGHLYINEDGSGTIDGETVSKELIDKLNILKNNDINEVTAESDANIEESIGVIESLSDESAYTYETVGSSEISSYLDEVEEFEIKYEAYIAANPGDVDLKDICEDIIASREYAEELTDADIEGYRILMQRCYYSFD